MESETSFISEGRRVHAVLSIPSRAENGVVFLHGGGQASTKRYTFLQDYFRGREIASLSFDFQGCGESEGKFVDGSLLNRLIDAEAAIEYFKKQSGFNNENIFLWGSSMGGHIACRLVEKYPGVKGIILQSAAAYGEQAEGAKFNEEFSKAIRQPESWKGSPAFSALRRFSGGVFLVYGENDTVIPEEIKNQYRDLLKPSDEYLILSGVPHALLNPKNETETQALEQLASASSEFVLHG